jgi:hypothetical protein
MAARGPRYTSNCIRCAKNTDATTNRPYPGNCFVCGAHLADKLAEAWCNETCGCMVACSQKCTAKIDWRGPGCPVCTKGGAPRYASLTEPIGMAEEKEEKLRLSDVDVDEDDEIEGADLLFVAEWD